MHDRLAALCLVFVIACSSSARPEGESDRAPSSEPVAGGPDLDPSLDTPRELREDAGAEPVADDEARTDTDSKSAAAAANAAPCQSLVVIADDGTFLGEASSKPFASNSVCNAYGSYGSPYGRYSIFNESTVYGNEIASTSAFNEFAAQPPHLYCETTNVLLNPITTNRFLPGAIDPDALCSTLARNGY